MLLPIHVHVRINIITFIISSMPDTKKSNDCQKFMYYKTEAASALRFDNLGLFLALKSFKYGSMYHKSQRLFFNLASLSTQDWVVRD